MRQPLDTASFNNRDVYFYGIAAMLCMLVPYIVFLTNNSYSLFALEVLPLYLCGLLVGLIVAIFVIFRIIIIARFLLWGCLVLSVALVGDIGQMWQVFLAATFAAIVIWLLRENAAIVVLVVTVTHIASTVMLSLVNPSTLYTQLITNNFVKNERSDLSPLVHIILDEFTGLHGFPQEIPAAQEVVSELKSYYLENGFDLYSHAYAQYLQTTDSIPNMFNFDFNNTVGNYISGPEEDFSMTTNKYFKYISSLGYKLHINQSSYLDFCSSPGTNIVACSEYASNSIGTLAEVDMPRSQKARFIFNSYLESSIFIKNVRQIYFLVGKKLDIELPTWQTGNSKTGPLAVMKTLSKLQDSLAALKPGEFHFAHLMIPHYPYIIRENCEVKPEIRNWLNREPFRNDISRKRNSADTRSERYEQYFAQIICTQSKIKMLFEAINASGQWEDSIIIIHGDHGSRILLRDITAENRDLLVEEDFRDTYSSFFAVKHSKSTGLLRTSPMPLPEILAEIWGLPVLKYGTGKVFLSDPGAVDYVAVPLKGFGELPSINR